MHAAAGHRRDSTSAAIRIGDPVLSPDDDPVWAARGVGKPAAIHVSLGDAMPFQLVANKLPGTVHFYDAPGRMLELIFGGVLDRFPGLRSA